MADRFWRGGTAAWDGTAGAKWAATAGGATGAAVPTSADDVFFDATSSGTCTISTGNTGAKSINCTGFTGTIAGSAAITVSGSLTFVAGMAVTYTGRITFAATATITSAGKTISGAGGGITVDGTGITVSLADALNVGTGRVDVNRGTFTTNDYNITAGDTVNNIAFSVTMNLGSSTITLSSTTPILFTGGANFTLNAGTSTFVLTSGSALVSGGVTFYNVSFTNTTVGTRRVEGVNTFNNLTVTGPASAGVVQVTFNSRQTINGTLSTTGTAGNRRVWFRGVTYGLAQTLTINATPSLTDADFRDIYVIGTAAPISGTRIGNLRGCRGITFDTPKSVYWVTAAGGNWSANAWAASSGAGASTDNFPLAQDTAVIENTGLNTSATVTLDSAITYFGTIDMSTRTNAMTLAGSTAYTVYGDWKFGSGVTRSYTGGLTFSGRNTQTITSAGKLFSQAFTIDSYGGSVELADALDIGTGNFTVTNGTFDTKNYNVTAGSLSSSNSNVRTIALGSSTVTTDGNTACDFGNTTNLTFNAGTSTISTTNALGSINSANTAGSALTFYNVNFNRVGSPAITYSFAGSAVFNNITVTAPTTAGYATLSVNGSFTVTGTLTVAGASPVRRIFVRSSTLGTTRTLTVGTLSATDCDFRDITIAGTAAGSSPTRAGDCGGNSGITFPAPKTVYWNLAGAQNWSATAWAPGSGGSPDINNFPLAQDTAVFDEAGSVTGTITIDQPWNIGTFDASARTSAMTLTTSTNSPFIYGDWKFGTGVTSSSTAGELTFAKRGTQTITSNGVTFNFPVTILATAGTVQIADALSISSQRNFTHTRGTFDAVTYNVTTGRYNNNSGGVSVLRMGTGTWTLSGNGAVWDAGATPMVLYKGTANIVLSDTSTNARTFTGSSLSYNKLTIGGATGTSTLTITGDNTFTELASTKTVAHTISMSSGTQSIGKWSITGTAGNIVTFSGSGGGHSIVGARVSGVDYLAMGTVSFSSTSPGEFYAGANSTGVGAGVILTAAPAPVTRYWVGGTGTWDATTTTKWSDSSGGSGGFSVPTSADAVIFDSASNATAYTVTCTATQLRCGSLTMAGPLVGNVTWAGSAPIAIHGNVTLPATGLTRTYTGSITLTGSTSGKTLTTNGVTIASILTVNGVGCEWTLGSALNNATTSDIRVTNGLFDTASYNVTAGGFISNHGNSVTYILGSSTIDFGGSGNTIDFGTTETNAANLTFTANTSQINFTNNNPGLNGNGKIFYNIAFTNVGAGSITINGTNSFNNLSFTGTTSNGLKTISITADQTINGTLTLSAGTNATMRHFVRSNTLGTARTLTCAAVSLTDVDFRDITIAGVAAPATGTRIGDCKGNSGITFDAAKTVYWAGTISSNWGTSGTGNWSGTSGGLPDATQFPLPQDTCIFESAKPNSGSTVTINAAYNIGTIDMSARTTNTMTLATGSTTPFIYGNWINGTGTTLTGTGTLTFAGRGSQTITSAGRTFTQAFTIDTLGGSVTLQDAFETNRDSTVALNIIRGTFNANSYSVTLSGARGTLETSGVFTRTVAVGSGAWTIAGQGTSWNAATSTNLIVTGTGTISMTRAIDKTFAGGGIAYTNITLNQGGAGTLTISGNNTFKDITNTYKATGATNITLSTTTQRVSQWTAAGESGRVLTVQGTSASSPATLILTGATKPDVNHLTATGIRAYNLTDTWYVGANSTNNGSLGLLFEAAPAPPTPSGSGNFFFVFL